MLPALLAYDYEVVVHRFRPPCPVCQRRMWPASGLVGEEVFRCLRHGWWTTDALEDHEGTTLPLVLWRRYYWQMP